MLKFLYYSFAFRSRLACALTKAMFGGWYKVVMAPGSLKPRLSVPDFVLQGLKKNQIFSKAVRQNLEWKAWVRG